MWKNIGVEKCVSFIESEFRPKHESHEIGIRPAITISRMTGAGGHTVASSLATHLQARIPGHESWTVFDRNLVIKVLEDHHMQEYVSHFMEESHKSMLRESVEEWMGLHPSSWTVVQWINATILRLAQSGNVILVGRGGMAAITTKVATVFHAYLIGSLEKRIERVKEVYGLDQKKAISYIREKDEGRRRYVKDNFGVDVDNPQHYHVTINTDLMGYDEAATLIGDEVCRRFNLDSVTGAKETARDRRLAR
jgi:cytidylate kinase